MAPLQSRLEDEIADMRGDLPGRQTLAVAGHDVAPDHAQVARAVAHQREHALRAVRLARNCDGAREAMRGGREVEYANRRRYVGLVAGEHQMKQAVVPS